MRVVRGLAALKELVNLVVFCRANSVCFGSCKVHAGCVSVQVECQDELITATQLTARLSHTEHSDATFDAHRVTQAVAC